MYLVLIETSGNQNFIFSTNKLKENIGASELTYRAGTQWIIQALHEVVGGFNWESNNNELVLREKLLDTGWNPPISNTENSAEIIVATSGKALILFDSHEQAKKVIQQVTLRALEEAPGLDICGVISDHFEWQEEGDSQQGIGRMNQEVHEKLEHFRSQRPGPVTRFLRLPIEDECATSGLPASYLDRNPDGEPVLRSAVSHAKRKTSAKGFERIEALLKCEKSSVNFSRSLRILDEEFATEAGESNERTLKWLSVVHADGNGLGEIFLNFSDHLTDSSNRGYVNQFRQFSIALDICTEWAFLKALESFPVKTIQDGTVTLLPVVPLILGGDDLTVVCDGECALQFTHRFLTEFEIATQTPIDSLPDPTIVSQLAAKALAIEPGRLSACAGIAIIKPHFPFSVAYELAEDLIQSAKRVKKQVKHQDPAKEDKLFPCSALDFHILYDSSGVNLEKIRQKLTLEQEGTRLYGRPYVVTPLRDLATATEHDWLVKHDWNVLQQRVECLKATDPETQRRSLPNSQMHDLREGLFLGKDGADARFHLIRDRYIKQGIQHLTANGAGESLFWQESDGDTTIQVTGFLDAMDAVSFWVEQS